MRENMVGVQSIVFTQTVFDKTRIFKFTNDCKSIVAIDFIQNYPHSMCQPIPTRLYSSYEFDKGLQRFKPRQKKI